MNEKINNSNVVDTNLDFKTQQDVAYAFLKAFYTREELGYSVDSYEPEDITPFIIKTVNKMGKDIVSNSRILVVVDFLKLVLENMGSKSNFISAFVFSLKDTINNIGILKVTEKTLKEEKERIKKNHSAYTALKLILNREKGNIELSFNGFM